MNAVTPRLRELHDRAFAAIYLPRVPRDADDLEPLDANLIELICDGDNPHSGRRWVIV